MRPPITMAAIATAIIVSTKVTPDAVPALRRTHSRTAWRIGTSALCRKSVWTARRVFIGIRSQRYDGVGALRLRHAPTATHQRGCRGGSRREFASRGIAKVLIKGPVMNRRVV